MSLTSYIEDRKSPVSEFLRTQFTNERSFLASARKQVRQSITMRQDVAVPWGIIATALDYRIRYYFAVTPYEELVAYKGARSLTEMQSEALSGELGYRWSGRRSKRIEVFERVTGKIIWNHLPERNGGWGIVDPSTELGSKAFELADRVANGEIVQQDEGDLPLKSEFAEFFYSLGRMTECNSPVRRRMPALLEDELNRHCLVLALLEEAFRSRNIDSVLAKYWYSDASALFGMVEDHWIDDLRELSWKFCEEYGHLASLPSVLNPSFDGSRHVGSADADLIVDGTLIDIKCTIKSEIRADWLRQVLGYVLLDHSDRYRITGIGIYMARQGLLFRWDLEEALDKLCSGTVPTIVELRARFREVISNTSNS